MEITFQIDNIDGWERVAIAGPINEDADVALEDLQPKLSAQIIFNFKQVSQINSCGVRAWINFLRSVEKDRKIVFEECTPEIIGQINMIPNFRGKAHIRSVYAGYVCPECEYQQWKLFEEGRNLPAYKNLDLPAVPCPNCGCKEMEMEELEDEFFQWMSAS